MTTGRTFDPARLAALPFRRPLLAALAISVCIAIMGVPDVLHNRPVFRALYLGTYLAWIAPTAWLQRALWRRRLPWWGAALVLLAATYAMSLVNSVIGQTLAIHLGLSSDYRWDMIFVGLDSCWLPLIAFCATHAVVAYNAALAQEQAHAAEAALLLRDAELRALRYQLQPHFLFNTLNALSSLVATGRQRDANRMIAQLADLLRATLAIGQAHEHSLADELALTESYLEIEKARLGERLHVTLDIGPGILDAQVPCLLLQPLVENAVRHGIAPRTEAGSVTLSIAARGDTLHVLLRNDVPEDAAADAGSSLRVGMRNVAERLERLYGGAHRFHAAAANGGGQFEVQVELPLRLGDATHTTWARAA